MSLPGSRGTRSWRTKSPVGFLRKHRDSWLLRARKEFEEFKKYCMNNGITLDMERAEKGKYQKVFHSIHLWQDLKWIMGLSKVHLAKHEQV